MRVIDVGIVSTAIGRRLTLFLLALVLAITVSAMWPDDDPRPSMIRVGVSEAVGAGDASRSYSALARLLTDVTGAPARIVDLTGESTPGCDLYLLPAAEYCAQPGLRALYAVRRAGGSEGGVIIAAAGDQPDVSELSPNDIVFVAARSVNGCWLQADTLSLRIDETFNFAGRAERVVAAVVHGRYRAGACGRPELNLLLDSGVVYADEIEVVLEIPGLPEVVLACYASELDTFEDILVGLGAAFASDSGVVASLETRTGILGFAPVGERQREALRALYERVQPE